MKTWSSVLLLGLLCLHSEFADASSVSLRGRNTHRRRNKPCGRSVGIPRILHHIFLDGEAVYWRNATVGLDFTSNFYPRTKEKGDGNATFRNEWKTGCQRLMSKWIVRQHPLQCVQKCIMDSYISIQRPTLTPKEGSCWMLQKVCLVASHTLLHKLHCYVQHRFWDMDAALRLIREQYSWFLPTFEGYTSVVAKGGLPQYFALKP